MQLADSFTEKYWRCYVCEPRVDVKPPDVDDDDDDAWSELLRGVGSALPKPTPLLTLPPYIRVGETLTLTFNADEPDADNNWRFEAFQDGYWFALDDTPVAILMTSGVKVFRIFDPVTGHTYDIDAIVIAYGRSVSRNGRLTIRITGC